MNGKLDQSFSTKFYLLIDIRRDFDVSLQKNLAVVMMSYFDELNIAITVSDREGNVLWMNDRSQVVNGGDFIGKNLLNCHPEPARTKLLELLKDHTTNAYTIEKNGVKKLIYQTPWFDEGEFAGYMEFSIEIPFEMPHYIRKPKA